MRSHCCFTCLRSSFPKILILAMEMKQNEEVASETHLVFNFMVSSPGGITLHGLRQCINCCGLKCNEVPARSMSPPGPVFHLSVYSTERSSEAANYEVASQLPLRNFFGWTFSVPDRICTMM